ncbi:PqqD family peptide modification chaperone [Photobacterium kasasachensis]|uniref:PqqD family peptide modification chaperone n=1 Tax=Photobacterium kasasachensis TaxID=2910240 RepID=UPI003D0BC1C3
MISSTSIIERSADQVSCELDGEIVLMSTATGKYFKLDNIGARIWLLLETPAKLADIVETILNEYEVSPEQGEREITAFIHQLLASNFICASE